MVAWWRRHSLFPPGNIAKVDHSSHCVWFCICPAACSEAMSQIAYLAFLQIGDRFLVYSICRKVNYVSGCDWKTILRKHFGNNRLAVYGNHLLPTNVKVNFQTCEVGNYRLYSSSVEWKYMLCWCRLSGSSWHPASKEHHVLRRMVFKHIKTLSKLALFALIKANRTRTSHKGIQYLYWMSSK